MAARLRHRLVVPQSVPADSRTGAGRVGLRWGRWVCQPWEEFTRGWLRVATHRAEQEAKGLTFGGAICYWIAIHPDRGWPVP